MVGYFSAQFSEINIYIFMSKNDGNIKFISIFTSITNWKPERGLGNEESVGSNNNPSTPTS